MKTSINCCLLLGVVGWCNIVSNVSCAASLVIRNDSGLGRSCGLLQLEKCEQEDFINNATESEANSFASKFTCRMTSFQSSRELFDNKKLVSFTLVAATNKNISHKTIRSYVHVTQHITSIPHSNLPLLPDSVTFNTVLSVSCM